MNGLIMPYSVQERRWADRCAAAELDGFESHLHRFSRQTGNNSQMPIDIYRPRDIAKIYGISEKRVREIASSRNVGTVVDRKGTRIFTFNDIAKLKPRPGGRPKRVGDIETDIFQ